VAIRITDIGKDLAVLNQQLAAIDQIRENVTQLQKNNGVLTAQVTKTQQQRGIVATNNVVFTWHGASLTFTWPAAFVRDASNNYYPIPAGTSIPLLASTFYWAAWNPTHQTMSWQTSVDALASVATLQIIANVFSGTAAQSGHAGGGGTEPGLDGINGTKYKLF
jgi:hypothetical protein